MSDTERCEDCGCELSYCGPMNDDGPSIDCPLCKMNAALAAANKEVERMEEQHETHIRMLRSAMRKMAEGYARIAKLEAVVGRLPKTADGVPVVPGMEGWAIVEGHVLNIEYLGSMNVDLFNVYIADSVEQYDSLVCLTDVEPANAFSTESAARDAAEQGDTPGSIIP